MPRFLQNSKRNFGSCSGYPLENHLHSVQSPFTFHPDATDVTQSLRGSPLAYISKKSMKGTIIIINRGGTSISILYLGRKRGKKVREWEKLKMILQDTKNFDPIKKGFPGLYLDIPETSPYCFNKLSVLHNRIPKPFPFVFLYPSVSSTKNNFSLDR